MRVEIDRLLDRTYAVLNWWLDGLWYGLPDRLKCTLFRRRQELVVFLDGGVVSVATPSGAALTVDTADSEVVTTALTSAGNPSDHDLILVLARTRVLTHTLRLPRAAEPDLRRVLHHELDRLMPFTIEDVAFDYHVVKRTDRQVFVDAAIAPRTVLEDALKAISRVGLKASSVTTVDAAGSRLPLNLLPHRRRLRLPALRSPARPRLALAAAVCVAAALFLPIYRYESVLAGHITTVESLRSDAVAARAQLTEHEASLARAKYLAKRRQAYLPPLELLKELTTAIPEHTWLTRFALSGGEVHLQGESAAATELLQVLESTPWLRDARFQAPVSRGDGSGKEQVSIVATLTRSPP